MYRIIGADGREYGPVSAEQVRGWVAERRANADSRAAAEGSSQWRRLADFPEFSLLFANEKCEPPRYAAQAPQIFSAPRKTNSLAVAGLVMGILSITGGLCCYGLPFNVLGLIFSIIALGQIRDNPQAYDGKEMAVAGIVLALLSLAFSLFWGLAMCAFPLGRHHHNIYRL